MQKKIIIWQSWFSKVGGVETGIYNFCVQLRDYYDIQVLTLGGDYKQLARLKQYAKVEVIDPKETYEADIIIRNSVWTPLPENIQAPRIIEMKHANYVYLRDSGRLKDQYIKEERVTEHLACGEYAAKMYEEYSGDKIPYIRNILPPKKKAERIYRFLSTSRIYDPDKGWSDIVKFCDKMKAKKIKFEVTVFSDLPPGVTKAPYEEIHIYEPRLDIQDYIADTDYILLFTKSEGCPYSILERTSISKALYRE